MSSIKFDTTINYIKKAIEKARKFDKKKKKK